MRIFIIAGEPSGDMYAGALIKSLTTNIPDLEIQGWGGKEMQATGIRLTRTLEYLSFMGYTDVIRHIPEILQNVALFKKEISSFRPDIILFIDYPGFNLKIAKWTKKRGITNLYFVPPATWAWKKRRIHALKKYFDALFVLFPFEKSFYKQHQLEVTYVGHPSVEKINTFTIDPDWLHYMERFSKPRMAFFPGSRIQEVNRTLGTMLQAAKSLSNYELFIAGMSHIPERIYKRIIDKYCPGRSPNLVFDKSYNLLATVDRAIVCSGTISLEAALFKVPQIVCYKTDFISYHIAKRFVKLDYISLVNILLAKRAVTELIQHDFSVDKLNASIEELENEIISDKMIRDYNSISEMLNITGGLDKISAYIKKTVKEN